MVAWLGLRPVLMIGCKKQGEKLIYDEFWLVQTSLELCGHGTLERTGQSCLTKSKSWGE